MQLARAQWRQRILDGAPRKLVPEGHGTLVQGENPGAEQLVDSRERRAGRCLQQGQFDAGRNDRCQLAEIAGQRRQPRGPSENRVAHGRRNARCVVAREHFGDEERIAAGGGVKALGAPPRLRAERLHRGRRERLQRYPRDDLAGQLADRRAQRVVGANPLLAPGQDEQRARPRRER